MPKSLNIRATFTFSAFAAITAIVAHSGTASAREVLSCEGGSRRSVVECCERLVLKKGLPGWMRQTGANCQSMTVRCFGGSPTITHVSKRKCVAIHNPQYEGHSNEPGKRGGGNQNGPNGPNGAGKR